MKTADFRQSGIARWVEQIPTDVRLFLAMMAVLVPARIAHTAQVHSMAIDGGYYLEVARHVRDGEGLVSNLSLYHFGYESFPHPTSIYPLWPWLLGMAARLADLEALAHWLPLALSFVAVTAAFLFGRRLWPESMLPAHLPGFHAGHLFALMLAVQADFVVYTSLPYTEGLGWALLFLFSWRVVVKGPDLGLAWAVETGVWLSLLYLARYQLLVAPLAMAAAYGLRFVLGSGSQRGRLLFHAAVALGIVGLVLGGWFLHLQTFVADAGVGSLLRFDQNRANHLLQPIDVIIDARGLGHLLLDRLVGVLKAWEAPSEISYTESFYTLHWALPAALPLLIAAIARTIRRDGLQGILERLRRPEVAHWFFVLLFAAGALLSVHAVHKHYNGEWYFSSRQGMVSLPAFALSLGWLLRQRTPWPTLLGVLVLSSTFAAGVTTVWKQVTLLPEDQRGEEPYGQLIAWMAEHADEDGRLIVALDGAQVQRVGWRTEGVGYHWISANTPYQDVLTMTDQLGARYVILRRRALQEERGWRLLSDEERLERDFVRLPDKPGNHVIFERKR